MRIPRRILLVSLEKRVARVRAATPEIGVFFTRVTPGVTPVVTPGNPRQESPMEIPGFFIFQIFYTMGTYRVEILKHEEAGNLTKNRKHAENLCKNFVCVCVSAGLRNQYHGE